MDELLDYYSQINSFDRKKGEGDIDYLNRYHAWLLSNGRVEHA